MKEYIEREAVMQAFADYVWSSNHCDLIPAPKWKHAVEIVRDSPAADVVEVVRCKDCKHRPYPNPDSPHGPEYVAVGEVCPYVCGDPYYTEIPKDNSFCDRGERR